MSLSNWTGLLGLSGNPDTLTWEILMGFSGAMVIVFTGAILVGGLANLLAHLWRENDMGRWMFAHSHVNGKSGKIEEGDIIAVEGTFEDIVVEMKGKLSARLEAEEVAKREAEEAKAKAEAAAKAKAEALRIELLRKAELRLAREKAVKEFVVGAVKAVSTLVLNILAGVLVGITWTVAKTWNLGVSIVKGLLAGATWFFNEMTVLGLRKKNRALLERIEALEASQAQQDVDISRVEAVASLQIDELAEVADVVKTLVVDTTFVGAEVADLSERLTVNEQVARSAHAEHSGVVSTVTRLSDNLGKLNDVVEGREARDLEKVLASTHRAATQEMDLKARYKVDACVGMASPKYSDAGVMVRMVMTMIIAEEATREMVEAKLNSKQYLHCDLTEVAVDVLECKLEKRKYMSKEYLAGLIYESCKAVVEQPRWANL